MIRVDEIKTYRYRIPLKTPFRISAGQISEKEGVIVEMRSGEICGFGEVSVDATPFYAHETTGSALDLLTRTFIPLLSGREFQSPEALVETMNRYRGGNFTKAAIEAAFFDILGKRSASSVHKLIGGVRSRVEVGPSVGIKDSPEKTVESVARLLDEGWRRIKMKVMPGFDTQYIEAVRGAFPEIQLMVDANNAYRFKDADLLASWDRFGLIMIEQPLAEDDIFFHSLLRKRLKTPICLDESIHSINDAKAMIALGAADILNVKICRVGGLVNAKKIIELCEAHGIGNWIGSRVGSGIAEAPRLAAATLANCVYAGDCVITGMYMSDDLLAEPYETNGCMVTPPDKPGLGFEIDRAKLARYAI